MYLSSPDRQCRRTAHTVVRISTAASGMVNKSFGMGCFRDMGSPLWTISGPWPRVKPRPSAYARGCLVLLEGILAAGNCALTAYDHRVQFRVFAYIPGMSNVAN